MRLVPDLKDISKIYITLSGGTPGIVVGGRTMVPTNARPFPHVPAAFELSPEELGMISVHRRIEHSHPKIYCALTVSYGQLSSLIAALGYREDNLSYREFRHIMDTLPIISHAVCNANELLYNATRRTGSWRDVQTDDNTFLVACGLATLGWVGSSQHIMLTAKGMYLARAVCHITTQKLTLSEPGQYVTGDLKIDYCALWNDCADGVCVADRSQYAALPLYI